MCGRYAAFREAQDLAEEFDVEEISERVRELQASWNVAPTDGARVVLDRAPSEEKDASRELHVARWGLLPPWAKGLKGGGPPMFNARIETLSEKAAFSKSLATRRCIVPADGYYEWKTEELAGAAKPTKTPFFIHDPSGASLAFAGLYSWWRDPSKADDDPERWVLSTTVITTAARDGLEEIHDREPIVLPHDAVDTWLDPEPLAADAALSILGAAGPELAWYEVGARVGSVRNNDAGLIAPA